MSIIHNALTNNQTDSIRTAKHRLLVDDATALAMVDYFQAYQDNKMFFSRSLNNKAFNNGINLKNNASYIDVRNHFMANGLAEFDTPLTARMWKNALEEAYLLQERTYAGGLLRVKNELNRYVFNHSQFHELTEAEKKSLFLLNYIISKTRNYFALLKYWQDGEILTGFQAFITDRAKRVNFPKFFNMMTYANKVKSTLAKFINHTHIPNLTARYQPTIRVDENCYTITSKYNERTKQYHHYLNLVNFNGHKRFTGIELSGYHHFKDFNKQVKYCKSLILSFDYEIKQGR